MPHHALEITLTRPLTSPELHHAARTMPLAANHDATRLMTVLPAKTPARAAHRLRRRLDTWLPVDVITTHYPDAHGEILLNIDFPPAAHTALHAAADHAGQTPRHFLQQAVQRALDQHARDEADRLDHALHHLLATTTSPHLLAALARALTHTPGATRC